MILKDVYESLGHIHEPYGHSHDQRVFWNFSKVVAMDKSKTGALVIVKGKRKYFAFAIIREGIYFSGYGRTMVRIELERAINILDGDGIVDEEEFKKLNDKLLIEAI